MSITRKVAAVTAAAALMAPIGVSQAHHESGKVGAPGQVCKEYVAAKKALKGTKGAERKAANKAVNAARKACIKSAVAARQAHNQE